MTVRHQSGGNELPERAGTYTKLVEQYREKNVEYSKSVPSTHLTLPMIYSVEIAVVAGSIKITIAANYIGSQLE